MTDKAEIARAIALAISELRRHGGTEAQVEMLRSQFEALADDEENRVTGKLIPS